MVIREASLGNYSLVLKLSSILSMGINWKLFNQYFKRICSAFTLFYTSVDSLYFKIPLKLCKLKTIWIWNGFPPCLQYKSHNAMFTRIGLSWSLLSYSFACLCGSSGTGWTMWASPFFQDYSLKAFVLPPWLRKAYASDGQPWNHSLRVQTNNESWTLNPHNLA